MKDVNVTVKGEVLTILEGKALEQKPSEKIEISGDIKSVSNFLSVRKNKGSGTQQIDDSKAIVFVDKRLLTIQLFVDPENHYGASVTGKLERSDEIAPFHINQNKTFTKEELVKLIKFNRIYFDTPTKHSEILLAFQKISSTVNIKANDSSDDRGNKERAYVKEVTTSAPTEFILNMPIFKGFDSVRFRVEICLDVTDGSARFWFESTELHELIQTTVDVIFNEELKSAKGLVVIYK
jgi:hypothetical protein